MTSVRVIDPNYSLYLADNPDYPALRTVLLGTTLAKIQQGSLSIRDTHYGSSGIWLMNTYYGAVGGTTLANVEGGVRLLVQSYTLDAVTYTDAVYYQNFPVSLSKVVYGQPSVYLISNDIIRGNDGNDTLFSYAGNDTVEGGAGNDSINGGAGDDSLLGGQGADVIGGGAGDDWLAGGNGRDTLTGGAGNDTLLGGQGLDRLNGALGDDSLLGGAGADVFVYLAAAGNDTIGDFSVSQGDTILVTSTTGLTVEAATGVTGTRVLFTGGAELLVLGATVSEVTSAFVTATTT